MTTDTEQRASATTDDAVEVLRPADGRRAGTVPVNGPDEVAGAVTRLRGEQRAWELAGFADLVNKRIVDLEDPAYADLVDTTLIRKENLGSKFQNRFLDSLAINDLRLEMGSDVWLRSAASPRHSPRGNPALCRHGCSPGAKALGPVLTPPAR